MKPKHLPQNLLKETWIDLDSDELRLLLSKRFSPGHGQYDGDDGKLYLPLARAQSRIVMTFDGNEIVVVEPGRAFDVAEWERMSQEIEREILAASPTAHRLLHSLLIGHRDRKALIARFLLQARWQS